jgi:hypothetical protein
VGAVRLGEFERTGKEVVVAYSEAFTSIRVKGMKNRSY